MNPADSIGSPVSGVDAGQRFLELLSTMARLRGEGGCPWDRQQTRESLRPFLLEEVHEVLDAIDRDDVPGLKEELGDLLLQVVFQAEVARERTEFSMAELLDGLVAKLVRRHPHVFGDRSVGSAAEALRQWEAIKQAEGGGRRSALEGVPRSLPGLLRAQRVQRGASRVGFDWPTAAAALEKVHEETAEVASALASGDARALREEIGDLLFAVVNVARLADVDAETALHDMVGRFTDRFRRMEDAAGRAGRDLTSLTLEELERLWTTAKAQEGDR